MLLALSKWTIGTANSSASALASQLNLTFRWVSRLASETKVDVEQKTILFPWPGSIGHLEVVKL